MFWKCEAGFRGIGPEAGRFIPAERCVEAALSECGLAVAPGRSVDREMLGVICEVFYSGNWIWCGGDGNGCGGGLACGILRFITADADAACSRRRSGARSCDMDQPMD